MTDQGAVIIMMVAPSDYQKLFEDKEYFLAARVAVDLSNGESTGLSTRFAMDGPENVKVGFHGYDNRVRMVTYKCRIMDGVKDVIEMYHKKNIDLKI